MRDLVVIGGSLVGLKTLCNLIDELPSPFQAPILAVVHASPGVSESPATTLGNCTEMPVTYGAEGDLLVAGHVYLAPPDRHIIVTSPGVLGVAEGARLRRPHPAADCLFESAARVYGPRVIGVVLGGGGDDGTDGLRAINAAGGIGVLQEAKEAVFSDAPPGALRTPRADDAHYRLPLEDIAGLLRNLIDHAELQPE
ncbi:chemotaxis protein CheB [Variovorax sp. J22P240]|uniref:chemotaxis protein CheB n=1 Tax=Variovorax sp. J22P240 TaxID=3053514 RepID=UPI002576F983|nr:chemotaxis protein CheB [Variovorax sp. J22P240]MDM0002275.1 chemotaxis protein CheB [Variovorax sp. J22P240]